MSLRTLESAILQNAQWMFNNPKLRLKDIREWSTGKIEPEVDEVTEFIPSLGVFVTIFKKDDKRKMKEGKGE